MTFFTDSSAATCDCSAAIFALKVRDYWHELGALFIFAFLVLLFLDVYLEIRLILKDLQRLDRRD